MSDNSAVPTFIRGVPHPLPAGERLLWEGAPNARAVARHVFKGRWIAAYFGIMLLLWGTTTSVPFGGAEYFTALGIRVALVAVVLGIVEILSQVVARTTVYAITDQRVVLRIGMVIPMSINVPFGLLTSASVAAFKDGTGQVLMELSSEQRIAYIALWPHCRAFRFTRPQPLLRGLLEPKRIGELLATAVADASERTNASSTDDTRATADQTGAGGATAATVTSAASANAADTNAGTAAVAGSGTSTSSHDRGDARMMAGV
ncbi:MAG TPA: photosynthetic complex putative assembly protein PuhB [Gemmatimonas sp.]|nr:photosynthetic complex putative assembly protein PuhB [Gemmatimonas sp.]